MRQGDVERLQARVRHVAGLGPAASNLLGEQIARMPDGGHLAGKGLGATASHSLGYPTATDPPPNVVQASRVHPRAWGRVMAGGKPHSSNPKAMREARNKHARAARAEKQEAKRHETRCSSLASHRVDWCATHDAFWPITRQRCMAMP